MGSIVSSVETGKIDNSKNNQRSSKPIKKQRIAVIGGGPSGCAVLRAFKSAADNGQDIPEVVCFEKQSALGGQWVYNWRTGLDEHNEPVHSGMYRYLWSNGPKECLEFADYSFDEHFKKPIPSYPPREVLADYISGRIEKSGIKSWVKFNHVAHNVVWDEKTQDFEVTVRKLENKVGNTWTEQNDITERFDYVYVCSGHFSVPNVPYFEGFDKYQGRILHSHDFRDAVEFKNQRTMVIGASYSAEDIASQMWKYGCKDITCCYRTSPMGFKWPKGFETKPLLQKVEGKKCFFKDGTTKEIDAIILCTGYKHHFPFLEKSLTLETKNRLWIEDCYQGIFWKNPRLMYIGMQDQWLTFNMFDAQAWYARDWVLGKLDLPSNEEQLSHWNKWRTREETTLNGDEDCIRFQMDYTAELVNATDYPSWDYEKTVAAFMEWEHNKHEDIMGFRDKSHTSAFTGTKAPIHHTVWSKALDDSMACYMKTKETQE